MNVFEILEIEPTEDKKKIKKAYASLARKYHPEEQPEKWKEIHDAYTMAMRIADGEENVSFFLEKDTAWEVSQDRQNVTIPRAPEQEVNQIVAKHLEKIEKRKQQEEQRREEDREKREKKSPERKQAEEQRPPESRRQEENPVVAKHLEKIEKRKQQAQEEQQVRERQQQAQERQRQEEQRREEDRKKREKKSPERKQTESEPENEQEMEDVFDNLSQYAETARQRQREEGQKQLEAAKREVALLCQKKKAKRKDWQNFFGKEEYQWAVCQGEFLYYWAECLETCRIDKKLYLFLKQQIGMIEQYQKNMQIIWEKKGLLDPCETIRMKLGSAYERGILWQKRSIPKIAAAVIVVATLLLLPYGTIRQVWVQKSEEEEITVSVEPSLPQPQVQQQSVWEKSFTVLGMMEAETQEKLLQTATPVAEGVYVLGDMYEMGENLLEVTGAEKSGKIPDEPDTENQSMENQTTQNQNAGNPTETEEGQTSQQSEYWLEKVSPTDGLPDGYAFLISATEQKEVAIWCEPEVLIGTGQVSVYYFDGNNCSKFLESNAWSSGGITGERYWHEFAGGILFYGETSTTETDEEYPIVIVGEENPKETGSTAQQSFSPHIY